MSGEKGDVPMCRHCGNHKAYRPRGLCYKCFKDRAIRDQYESKNPRASTEKREWPHCWSCGSRAPRPTRIRKLGWHTARIKFSNCAPKEREIYCPACIARGDGPPDWKKLILPDGGVDRFALTS